MTEPRTTARPALPVGEWIDTIEAVHLGPRWSARSASATRRGSTISWGVTLYVSTRGLRTSLIPFGTDAAELEFEFIDHAMSVHTTAGRRSSIPLHAGSIADMYRRVLDAMTAVGMPVSIHPMPSEIPGAIAFDHDTAVRPYEPEHARALWRALVQADRVLTRFRAGFKGKASPVPRGLLARTHQRGLLARQP